MSVTTEQAAVWFAERAKNTPMPGAKAMFEIAAAALREKADREKQNREQSGIFAGYPLEYKPVCPRGYTDCVYDPAYIKFHHPEWYKELHGDMTPEEAVHKKGGCYDKVEKDPDEEYYCYDDEDK